MKWSYKTVHFELKKEGLLGGAFLDEAEIEERLNDYGRAGWELISVLEVQDGIIAFFKQSLNIKRRTPQPAEDEDEIGYVDKDDYILEPDSAPDSYATAAQDSEQGPGADEDELERHEEPPEESYRLNDSASAAAGQYYGAESGMKESDDQNSDQEHEEQGDDPLLSGIGAIKIE